MAATRPLAADPLHLRQSRGLGIEGQQQRLARGRTQAGMQAMRKLGAPTSGFATCNATENSIEC